MSSLNLVQLIGNLGRDPELKTFSSGGKVCNLRIATSQNWKDKATGEKKERTEWHSVSIFNERLADIAYEHLRKGSKVYVQGALETRKWQDQQGNDRYTTEVVVRPYAGEIKFLGGTADREGRSDNSSRDQRDYGAGAGGYDQSIGSGYGAGGGRDLEDEIPF